MFEMNTLLIGTFGLAGWGLAVYVYNLFNKAQEKNEQLEKQKQNLRGMISDEIKGKYESEISELRRYQTHYLVHMEERDKILSSLATLIKSK